MGKQQNKVDLLYNAASSEYDLGTKDEFVKKLQDPNKRKALYDAIGEQYNLGTFEEFTNKVTLKKKDNPTGSFGMASSLVGKDRLPVGVASQKTLQSYGVTPVGGKTTSKEIYKGVVSEANRQSKLKPKPADNRNIVEKVVDPVIETLTSGVTQIASGAAGLIGGTASLLVTKDKDIDNKKYPIFSDEWLRQKYNKFYTQQGEVKDPSWFSNQGIRDNFMKLSKTLSDISSTESSIAKDNLGVKNTQKSSIDHILEGNYKDAAKSALVDIGAQIPMLATMVYTGGSTASFGAMGATSMGSELNRQYEQDGDINSTDYVQGITNGIVEVIAERALNMDLKAGGQIMAKVSDMLGDAGNELRKKVQSEGVDKVAGEIVRNFSDVFKQGAKGAGQEWAEENIVSTVNYLTRALDEDVFNKEEFGKFVKELGNNAIVAGPLGGGMSTLAAAASMTPLTNEEKVKIEKYTEIINDENSSNEVKRIAKQKIQEVQDGRESSSEEMFNGIVNLPIPERVEAISKINKISKLEEEAKSVKDVDIKDSIEARISELKSEIGTTIASGNELTNSKEDFTIDSETTKTPPTEEQKLDDIIESPQSIDQPPPVVPPTVDDTTPIEEPKDPNDARQKSMQMMKDQEDALRIGAKKTGFWNKWIKRGFERQINVIKAMGDSPEAKKAKTMMTVVAGARSAADSKFKDSESKVYKGLNLSKEKILDEILFHKRVSQIDSNYDKKGEKRIEHPRGFNKEESELALQGIKNEIGEKEYDNLIKRSEDYFKSQNDILASLYDGGLINETTFNNLKDDDYIKRVFLDHINQNADGDAKALGDFGLSKDQVKSLKDGSTGLLLMDSRVLLNAAYRSAEQRVFQNKANKALSDVVKINPELGYELKPEIKKLKDGSTRREIPPARNGYTKIRYFEKGVEYAVEVKDNIAKEWLDLEKKTTELDSAVRILMGTALLKNLATGINATFAIGNIPADYLNVILFTDTFDNTNVFNAMQKLGRSFTSNMGQLSVLKSTGKATDSFRKLESDFTKYGGKMEFLTTYGRPDDLIKRDRRYGNVRNTLGKVGKKAVDVLAFTGEQSELAMRLSVFDEVRNQAVKKAGGRDKISDSEWDDISYEAAAKARKTMDFAKGGLWAKKLDNVSPYLNASAQGTRVAAEYIYKNPKKFSEKITQIGMATAALVLYNMMVGDEDDLKNIPDYVKKNYFVIFDPKKHKNSKGQDVRGYHLIKKTPALQPFLNLFESGTMAAYNLATGRKFGEEESFVKSEWTAVNNALPIPLDIRELPNKMPPIPKAVLSYFANYDFYRNQNIVSKREEDLLPKYQGVTDENVPTFFKGIGQYTGLSPKKLQASTEMIITNPRTNTMIGGAYAILDKMTEKYVEMPESWKNKSKEISTIFGGAKARVYREVDYNYSSYNSEKLKDLEKELKSKKFLIKNEVADLVEKQASKSDVVEFIRLQDVSNDEKKTLLKYAINIEEDKTLKQKLPNYYKLSPIKYFEGSPEDKAKLLSVNIGIMDPRSEEFKDLAIEMDKMKIPLSDRFISEYQRIYQETVSKNK